MSIEASKGKGPRAIYKQTIVLKTSLGKPNYLGMHLSWKTMPGNTWAAEGCLGNGLLGCAKGREATRRWTG